MSDILDIETHSNSEFGDESERKLFLFVYKSLKHITILQNSQIS